MKFGSLFAGIGGFDLGLERAGLECRWQVEIDEWCRKVLTKHWPAIPKYADIREVGRNNLETVDLICGGFPCQPFSVAGKRRGTKDNRYLWPEMLRVVSAIKPKWVIAENVHGLLSINGGMVFEQVLSDLETECYEVTTFVVPACAADAPHRRDRVWIIANATNAGFKGVCKRENTADANGRIWPSESGICRVDDGVPNRLDRLRGLGNAVVPQVVEMFGRAIMDINKELE